MRGIIRWAIDNSPAMNVMMIASLFVGTVCMLMLRREVFPEFELEIILVSVPYPGASPDEVEEGICQKLEEALQTVDGVKKMTSVAREGSGFLVLELESSVSDVQKLLNEVRAEIDQIPSFPELTEDPEVQQITFRSTAISLGIIGPPVDGEPSLEYDLALRQVAEEVRKELLQMPPPAGGLLGSMNNAGKRTSISSANIVAAKEYQIDVEISEQNLREYGLTLQQIGNIIRRENMELPAGKMQSAGQEILVRGKNKSSIGAEIENIKIRTKTNGDTVAIKDIGRVVDGFSDGTSLHRIDGNPGLVINIERTSNEDLFTVVNAVKAYMAQKQMPPGYQLKSWNDTSVDVQDRLDLLTRNGLQGLALVFIVLAVFLELRLAFWVALGIPISILGAGYVLLGTGQTLNMLSMFAFLMALGIVVDDAIVIGENIYEHRQMGKSDRDAAIDGTLEVLPSVTASVFTTIIAFMPLMFVSGVMGKFIAVMPVAVIAMLLISLVESMFILPSHLAHENNLFMRFLSFVLTPFFWLKFVFDKINKTAIFLLQKFIDGIYLRILKSAVQNKLIALSAACGIFLMAIGLVVSGITPFVIFPKLDSRVIIGTVVYPDGTTRRFADESTQLIEAKIKEVNDLYAEENGGAQLVDTVYRSVGQVQGGGALGPTGVSSGSHVSSVQVQLVPTSERNLTSAQIISKWRELVGRIPGTEVLKFAEMAMGPGGTPIEFKILADKKHSSELDGAVEECKAQLASYAGVFDIEDDARLGKYELQVQVKPDGKSLGLTEDDLQRTVRSSYYGEEIQRLQRGRHEVKLMVRYPPEERSSAESFDEIRVRGSDNLERPITEVAAVSVGRGYSEINRIDQRRSVTLSADVDAAKGGNAFNVTTNLKSDFIPGLMEKYPNITVKWEGQAQQSQESLISLMQGTIVAIIGMYVLLVVEFRSYIQPLIILFIIPFGIIGAIVGHTIMGIELTLFSFFGLVALTGVIVNDSIVLVDFINLKLEEGMPIEKAVVEAGRRRFRPVLLTSLTTVAGLFPILLERSFQAQVLIPMAVSLCFGLLAATSLILLLVPVFYQLYYMLVHWFSESILGTEEDDSHLGEVVQAEPALKS